MPALDHPVTTPLCGFDDSFFWNVGEVVGWILHKNVYRLDWLVFVRAIESSYPEFSLFSTT